MDYDKFVTKFDASFTSFVSAKIAALPRSNSHLKRTGKWMMRTVVSQGKRVRPYLVCVGHESVASRTPELFRVAIGIELLHLFALIHDDIIDRASTRRHFPTVHEQIADSFSARRDHEHIGTSLALLVGDLLLAWSYECVYLNKKIVQEFQETVEELIAGQYEEVAMTQQFPKITKQQVRRIAIHKSGRYTILRPFTIGRAAAGGRQLKEFSAFADALGFAFQLQDDLLGMFGDEKKTGKSVSSDITEGKPTLLAWYAYHSLRPADQKTFLELYGKKDATRTSCALVKKMILSTTARSRVEEDASTSFALAKSELTNLRLPQKTKKELMDFIDLLEHRSS